MRIHLPGRRDVSNTEAGEFLARGGNPEYIHVDYSGSGPLLAVHQIGPDNILELGSYYLFTYRSDSFAVMDPDRNFKFFNMSNHDEQERARRVIDNHIVTHALRFQPRTTSQAVVPRSQPVCPIELAPQVGSEAPRMIGDHSNTELENLLRTILQNRMESPRSSFVSSLNQLITKDNIMLAGMAVFAGIYLTNQVPKQSVQQPQQQLQQFQPQQQYQPYQPPQQIYPYQQQAYQPFGYVITDPAFLRNVFPAEKTDPSPARIDIVPDSKIDTAPDAKIDQKTDSTGSAWPSLSTCFWGLLALITAFLIWTMFDNKERLERERRGSF